MPSFLLLQGRGLPAERPLRPEEVWRPAKGRDLSKFQPRHVGLNSRQGGDNSEVRRRIFKRNAGQQKHQEQEVTDCGLEGPVEAAIAPLIIGGETAEEGQFPWAAALFIDGAWFCTGTLISDSFLLTAAHCVEGASYFDIVLGSVDIRNPSDHRVEVTSYSAVVHPLWNHNDLTNDIALIQLPSPLQVSSSCAVCMAISGEENTLPSSHL